MGERELACLVCGKTFRDAIPRTEPGDEEWARQPIGAMVFRSHGHYGSQFDPIEPNMENVAEVWICDEHVLTAPRERVAFKCASRKFVEYERPAHIFKQEPTDV